MTLTPYSEYKSAPTGWIGEIPAHWAVERIKFSLAEKTKVKASGLPAGAISYGRVVKKDGEKIAPETLATYQEVRAGEFLINPINLNYDLVSLRTALADINVAVSPAYIVARGNGAKIDNRYASYLLHIFDIRHMKTLGAGIRQTIGFDDIGNCQWALPPLQEQNNIANYLDVETARIDRLVEHKNKFVRLVAERIVASVIELTKARNDWHSRPFCSIARSKSISGQADEGLLSVYLDRGVIPYSEGGGLVHKPAESLEKYQLVEPGDLVMNNQQAWRGSLGVSQHRGIVSPAYLVFELDREQIDPAFANYAFRSKPYVDQFMLASMSVGDIQRQLKWPHLRKVMVSLPPLSEQKRIVTDLNGRLFRLEGLIQRTRLSVLYLQEKRTALITAAVTGKIDVRSHASQNLETAA